MDPEVIQRAKADVTRLILVVGLRTPADLAHLFRNSSPLDAFLWIIAEHLDEPDPAEPLPEAMYQLMLRLVQEGAVGSLLQITVDFVPTTTNIAPNAENVSLHRLLCV